MVVFFLKVFHLARQSLGCGGGERGGADPYTEAVGPSPFRVEAIRGGKI